jgi:hypothetical protein
LIYIKLQFTVSANFFDKQIDNPSIKLRIWYGMWDKVRFEKASSLLDELFYDNAMPQGVV